jgi:hypothetical protein
VNARGRRTQQRAADRGAKFGAADPRHEERRQAERRTEELSGDDLDARLRQLGINTDRRQRNRRQGGERRHR